VDTSSPALDMTNFATFIDSANSKAPIEQRGKAKQKRTDLRIVGLGLVVTRDGGIPLVSHAYPGNKPDVTQFATMVDMLTAQHAAVAGQAGANAAAEMTVVFDAGQNSQANFDHIAELELHYVGSVPPSDVPDLLALPSEQREIVDADRFEGLTALEIRRVVLGAERRVVLTHSPTLHAKQQAGVRPDPEQGDPSAGRACRNFRVVVHDVIAREDLSGMRAQRPVVAAVRRESGQHEREPACANSRWLVGRRRHEEEVDVPDADIGVEVTVRLGSLDERHQGRARPVLVGLVIRDGTQYLSGPFDGVVGCHLLRETGQEADDLLPRASSRSEARTGGLGIVRHLRDELLDNRRDQVGLGREVAVQGAHGHARRGGDLVHPDVRAVRGHLLTGSGKDLPTVAHSVSARRPSHGH
jgi:hypothetical protein